MDFTEIYPQSSYLVSFSPGNQFILTAKDDKLIVRRAQTLQITRLWQLEQASGQGASDPPRITHIGWSCDSEFVLAACAKHGFVRVCQLRDESWTARIEAGVEGLSNAVWAPDGRHILCFSEWGLRVTIWSLVTGQATYIQYPNSSERCWDFRPDGRYLILADRQKSKDYLGIYDAEGAFKLTKHLQLPTSSLSGISISPRGTHLAVWDGALEYKLFVLALSGRIMATFTPRTDPGLGIKCISWHPGGTFLAVGGWDTKMYLLDNLSWSEIFSWDLHARVSPDVAIWKEKDRWAEEGGQLGFFPYEREATFVPLSTRSEPTKLQHPKSGISELSWNLDGTLLLVRTEQMTNVVFILQVPGASEPFRPKLRSVLVHHQAVTHARWNPVKAGSLALTCGTNALYIWSNEWVNDDDGVDEMAECVSIPSREFLARDMRWSPDGKTMVLLDKEQFCCAMEVQEP